MTRPIHSPLLPPTQATQASALLQQMSGGRPVIPTGVPGQGLALSTGMRMTLLGVIFELDDATPITDAVRKVETTTSRLNGTAAAQTVWVVSSQTFAEIKAESNGMIQSITSMLRQADREGKAMVQGVVRPGARRGSVPPAEVQRTRKGNVDSLAERARGLMVQIATMSDAGPIPDGQMAELTKTYAALQAELDDVKSHLADIEEHLSIGRAIIFEYTMPS